MGQYPALTGIGRGEPGSVWLAHGAAGRAGGAADQRSLPGADACLNLALLRRLYMGYFMRIAEGQAPVICCARTR